MKAYKSGPSTKGLDIPADIARLDAKIGKQEHYPPSLLAAQQLHESGFNPSAVSSAGAFGLSQFIPGTAAEYGVQQGSSKKAVKSQVRGQARYMKSLGAPKDTANALGGYLGDHNPNSSYAQGIIADQAKYKQLDKPAKKPNPKDVHKLQKAGIHTSSHGTTQKKVNPVKTAKQFKGHYVNPYGTPTEIDQGVDYGGTGDIRTIGKAKVVDTGNSSFGGGPFLAYELQDGPRKGWTVYAAEGVSARSGLRVGQVLPKGAVFAHQSGGIETGWAAKPGVAYRSGQTLSAATGDSAGIASRHSNFTGTPSSSDPVAGRDFLKFLQGKPGMKITGSGGASSGGISFTSSAGVSSFTSATGMTAKQAQHMSPRQRMMALRTALNKTLRGYGGLDSASHSAPSSQPLKHVSGKPVV